LAAALIPKPSRLNNLSYLLFGYYLSSAATYSFSLTLEQKLVFIVAFGSFIGSLIYYLKPIERLISLGYRLAKNNETTPVEPNDEFCYSIKRSEIVFSAFLQDDRMIINGAFFFGISLLLSGGLLSTIDMADFYLWLQVLTATLFALGIWESYTFVKRKMPIVVYYYNNYNLSKYVDSLEKAISRKDWVLADKIMEKEPDLSDPYAGYDENVTLYSKYGVCTNCQAIRLGYYCIKCGQLLTKNCPKCKNILIGDETELSVVPVYCKSCGKKI
jgi:hypothetical protein